MEDRTITKHYFISGRVQGVGFRAFARRLAQEMKLEGWVRNLKDGRVEAMVRGFSSGIESFEQRLKQGPAHGQVERLEIQDGDLAPLPPGFEIRKDGV